MNSQNILAVTNQKGGVGKSTTTVNLAAGLVRHGKRVLVVDADPQGNLTQMLGWQQPERLDVALSSFVEAFMIDRELPWNDGLLHNGEGIDLLPANIELSGTEIGLFQAMSREQALKSILMDCPKKYDYVLIDCSPSLGMLTINTLAAADRVIIPVQTGYGSYRLCHWLDEHNITRADGKGFPNTTIQRIIQNIAYTGVIKNGDAMSEIIPELQIIEPEVYNRAQEIRTERLRPHNPIPLNCKGTALLVGFIYCGHCGNRLTLTTSGGRKHSHDGTRGPARVRYECHYKKRHPRECDGPTGYGQAKLDPIVDKMVRMKFAEIKATPRRDVILEQKQKEISQHKTAINRLMTMNRTKQKEVEDYKAEIIKVIRGESKLNAELINDMISKAENEIKGNEDRLKKEQETIRELEVAAKALEKEYSQIISWADMYENASIAGKKMILSQFIRAVRVSRDYEIDIELNISFEQFKTGLRACGSRGGKWPVAHVGAKV